MVSILIFDNSSNKIIIFSIGISSVSKTLPKLFNNKTCGSFFKLLNTLLKISLISYVFKFSLQLPQLLYLHPLLKKHIWNTFPSKKVAYFLLVKPCFLFSSICSPY